MRSLLLLFLCLHGLGNHVIAASITLYDVGQGDCILVRCPAYDQGKTENIPDAFLVDCGSTKQGAQNYDFVFSDIYSAIFSADAPTLNQVVITHGDRDHYSKLLTMLGMQWTKAFVIERFVVGGKAIDYGDEKLKLFNKSNGKNPFYTTV